jgi:hypothetical protein
VVSTGSIACGYERKPRRSSTTCTPAALAAVLKSTRDLGLTVIALQKKHALVRTVVCMSSKLLTLVVLADCAGLKPCSEEPVSNLCTPGAALPTAAEAPLTPIRIFVGRSAMLLTFAPVPYTSGDHCTGDTSGDPRVWPVWSGGNACRSVTFSLSQATNQNKPDPCIRSCTRRWLEHTYHIARDVTGLQWSYPALKGRL